MQFWPPDDEHVCSEHVEALNKLIVKQKFCASSWLITEINIPICTVSKTSKYFFYIYGSVHRLSTLITVQRDPTQSSLFIILQVHSTCFGCQPHPSSAVHKTVTTASGTVKLPLAWPCCREVAAQKIWAVAGAVITVLCTPGDGCGWHPKHVEWTCRIINRMLFFCISLDNY